MSGSNTITVDLGEQQEGVERRLQSGDYDSASDVVRAAIRALDREEAVLNDLMREKIRASLDDPHPDRPADEVFARLRAYHEREVKAGSRGA